MLREAVIAEGSPRPPRGTVKGRAPGSCGDSLSTIANRERPSQGPPGRRGRRDAPTPCFVRTGRMLDPESACARKLPVGLPGGQVESRPRSTDRTRHGGNRSSAERASGGPLAATGAGGAARAPFPAGALRADTRERRQWRGRRREAKVTTETENGSALAETLVQRIGKTVGDRAQAATIFGKPVERDGITWSRWRRRGSGSAAEAAVEPVRAPMDPAAEAAAVHWSARSATSRSTTAPPGSGGSPARRTSSRWCWLRRWQPWLVKRLLGKE